MVLYRRYNPFLFIIQFITGIVLSFYYIPYFEHAHKSIIEIVTKLNMGWFSAPSIIGAPRSQSLCSSFMSGVRYFSGHIGNPESLSGFQGSFFWVLLFFSGSVAISCSGMKGLLPQSGSLPVELEISCCWRIHKGFPERRYRCNRGYSNPFLCLPCFCTTPYNVLPHRASRHPCSVPWHERTHIR